MPPAASDLAQQSFAVELVSSPYDVKGATPKRAWPCHATNPTPIPGYTFKDCTAAATDSLDYVITWNNQSDLSPLLGKSVYVRFYLRNVGLYSLRFRNR